MLEFYCSCSKLLNGNLHEVIVCPKCKSMWYSKGYMTDKYCYWHFVGKDDNSKQTKLI